MANMNDAFSKLEDFADKLANMKPIDLNAYSSARNIISEIPVVEVDEESTFAYQMKQQINRIIEKSNEQITLLVMQNEQLINNYQKLEELYKIKEQELLEAKKEAKKAKVYNTITLIIAIVSMLTAIAAWLLPNLLGGAS